MHVPLMFIFNEGITSWLVIGRTHHHPNLGIIELNEKNKGNFLPV